jgi:TonB family protein
MRRYIAILQSVTLFLAVFCTLSVPAFAAPRCQAVADAMTTMETNLKEGWAAKNAGGQESLARLSANYVMHAFDAMDLADAKRCLTADGQARLIALLSKGNGLLAVLDQTTAQIRPLVSAERDLVSDAKRYQRSNPVYWQAINNDMVKIQRRYADVARAERETATARRQALQRALNGHDAVRAHSIATMDAKRPASRHTPPSAASNTSGTSLGPCARPNVPPSVVHAIEPDTPALAQQQGIQGTVQILVSLDTDGKVTSTRIQSSPSAVLNAAALAAARQSTFQPELRDCKPVPSTFVYSVEFSDQ